MNSGMNSDRTGCRLVLYELADRPEQKHEHAHDPGRQENRGRLCGGVRPAVPRTSHDAERGGPCRTPGDHSGRAETVQHRHERADPEQGIQAGFHRPQQDARVRTAVQDRPDRPG